MLLEASLSVTSPSILHLRPPFLRFLTIGKLDIKSPKARNIRHTASFTMQLSSFLLIGLAAVIPTVVRHPHISMDSNRDAMLTTIHRILDRAKDEQLRVCWKQWCQCLLLWSAPGHDREGRLRLEQVPLLWRRSH